MPTVQLFTDYLVRLMKYVEFMKKVVPLHDDLFDFFYEALPGYEEVGRRRILLGCWGSFQNPDVCDYTLQEHDRVGPGDVRHARRRGRRQARHHRPGRINLGIRILLGSSYYDDWENAETFVKHDPLGNPVDRRHPWNQTTIPKPQKRDFKGKYTWVMSPRWYDERTEDHLALDTGGGPLARLWATALAGLVDIGYIKATGQSVKIYLPKTASLPEVEFEWKIPKWSNAIERDRARTYFQAYSAAAALYFVEQALKELHAGRTKTWTEFKVPDEAIGCGFHEAVRGVLSHHVVIRDGKIANYHPYPPTPWNANPRDIYGTPGPYEDAVQNTPIFEENGPDKFKGIDIMRAVRSFDPCLPCGVHMYLGNGKVLRRGIRPCSGQRDQSVFGADSANPARGSDLAARIRDPMRQAGSRTTSTFRISRGAAAVSTTQEPEVRRRIEHLEALIQDLERLPDPAARDQARELVQALLEFHGAALARLLERIAGMGEPGHALIAALAGDDLVSSLLLLYDFIPLDLETRVESGPRSGAALLRTHGAMSSCWGSTMGSSGCGCRGAATAARRRR